MIAETDHGVSWEASVLFHDAPPAAVERIRPIVRQRSYRADDIIFEEGDPATDLYLLRSGKAELTYRLPTRHDTTLRITLVEPGDVFAWSALTGGSQLTAMARAVEESKVFLIRAADLTPILASIPEFGYRVMDRLAALIAGRLRDTRTQLQWLSTM